MALGIPTFAALYQAYRDEVEGRNAALSDWNEGSNLDALGGGSAVLADEIIRWGWSRFGAQFVDLASGSDLDALLLDRFNLTRKPASAAVGTLTFTRGGSSGTITIPSGTVVQGTGSDGGTVQVETDSDVDLIGATVDATATCTTTGRAGNVAASVLTTIPTAVPADPTLTVTNAARFAGGGPEETDDQFRARGRRYFGTLRKGTIEAWEAGALEVAGVTYVTIKESHILPSAGGYVDVYIADQDGYGNAALAALVTTELVNWRACGVQPLVTAATRESAQLALTLYVDADSDQAVIRTAAKAAVLAYTDALAPGETLYLSRASHEAFTVADEVRRVVFTVPNTGLDIAPSSAAHILRVASTDLSITISEL